MVSVDRQVSSTELRKQDSRRLGILIILFIIFGLFYYFGELVDFAGWKSLQWNVFYTVHDIHRLLFLIPIVYTGYFFGARAAVIITLVTGGIFMPRALFVSPYPDPLVRAVLFIIIVGITGYLIGSVSEKNKHLKNLRITDKQAILTILDRIEDEIVIFGPDRRIRFINSTMEQDFGRGIGTDCNEYLRCFGDIRRQLCKDPAVMSTAVDEGEYTLSDGRTYKIVTAPFLDSDTVVCQLVIFKNITPSNISR